MAYSTKESVTTTEFTTNSTTHNVAMPATVNAGDYLIVLMTLYAASSYAPTQPATPADWNLLSHDVFAGAAGLSIYYKVADGSEDGTTVNFSTSPSPNCKGGAVVYRYSGVSDIEVGTASGADTANPNPPSLTPSWGSAETTFLAIMSTYSRSTTGYPSGYSEGRSDNLDAADSDGEIASCWKQSTGTTEDPGTFTISSSQDSVAQTIALKPVDSEIPKSFSDAGAEGAESYHLTKQKAYADAGAEGAEAWQLAKEKAYSDAGAEGAESFVITEKHKAFADAGAEGSENFSKDIATSSFPVVESITQTTFGSAATSHLVQMPATVNSGDLLYVIFANDGNTTVTTPSGWTLVDSTAFGTNFRAGLYKKKANGSEGGATVDFVTSAAEPGSAQVRRITGWYGDIALSVEYAVITGTSSSPNPPSLNPTNWDIENTLWLAAFITSSSTFTTVNSYPSNYLDGTLTSSGTGGDHVHIACARRELAAALEDPGTFSTNGSSGMEWVVYTIAIRGAVFKDFTDAGADGAESFSMVIAVPKAYSDAGPEGTELYTVAKLKAFTDAGVEGSESWHLTKHKSITDAGAEGSELFSKTRFINPVYLKNRFEAITIKVLDS